MKGLLLLFLSCHAVSAVLHSLVYISTASSGVPNFPEFVAVGLVDDVQLIHCDSNTQRAEPKQDWMSKVTADDPQYWERNTGYCLSALHVLKARIEIIKQHFNQTGARCPPSSETSSEVNEKLNPPDAEAPKVKV